MGESCQLETEPRIAAHHLNRSGAYTDIVVWKLSRGNWNHFMLGQNISVFVEVASSLWAKSVDRKRILQGASTSHLTWIGLLGEWMWVDENCYDLLQSILPTVTSS